jgi:mRNA interferase MazF
VKRGDLLTVSLRGNYGKPRPAVVIQSDRLALRTSVLVCPLTSDLVEAISLRPIVEPSPETGLRTRSQVMVDKISVVEGHQCGARIGQLDPATMERLDASLAFVIGLTDSLS